MDSKSYFTEIETKDKLVLKLNAAEGFLMIGNQHLFTATKWLAATVAKQQL